MEKLDKESKDLIEEFIIQRLFNAKVEEKVESQLDAMKFIADEDQRGDVVVYASNMSILAYAAGFKDSIRLMGVE